MKYKRSKERRIYEYEDRGGKKGKKSSGKDKTRGHKRRGRWKRRQEKTRRENMSELKSWKRKQNGEKKKKKIED